MAEKCKYRLLALAILLNLAFVIMAQEEESRCYSCGYMLTSDGTKTEIPEKYEKIAFCTEDKINKTSNENTKPIGIGGCCVAFKMFQTGENGEGTIEIHRYGAATEDDLPFADFPCGETVQGYDCKHDHFNGGGYDDDGEICHCFENKCNTYIPDLPDNSTTPAPSNGSALLASVTLLLVSFLIAGL